MSRMPIQRSSIYAYLEGGARSGEMMKIPDLTHELVVARPSKFAWQSDIDPVGPTIETDRYELHAMTETRDLIFENEHEPLLRQPVIIAITHARYKLRIAPRPAPVNAHNAKTHERGMVFAKKNLATMITDAMIADDADDDEFSEAQVLHRMMTRFEGGEMARSMLRSVFGDDE